MAANYLAWPEDKTILQLAISKYITELEDKPQKASIFDNEFRVSEEDRQFLKELFKLTIQHEGDFQSILTKKLKNWDISRLALTDRILIKMAMCEMVCFTSIPIKVSINEYIEIAKLYSTPKSKKFVNGLLDVIAEDFIFSKIL